MAVILSPRGNEASNMMKRFVRYEEAAQYFGIDETLIVAYAKAAGAVYQLSKIRLIKIEPLEDYMKHLTKVGRSSKLIQRKFVRVGEGTLIYNIGRNRFIEMARAAGSKISVENMKIEKEYFNLSESIREVLIMLENKWSVKKLSIDLELQDFLYLGSKEMMEEVWNNLIGNAIKFSDSGGQLKIKSLKNKNTVIVIISDNGIGMTKETQEKIYDKFFQADTSHSQDGAGLGLSIVKRIIAVHQGKIHIDSELNKGTTFTIDLPMLKK